MDNIIIDLFEKKWDNVHKAIIDDKIDDKIDYEIMVDGINPFINYLAYHNAKLIKDIDTKKLPKLILIPDIEGNTVGHIASKLHNIDLTIWLIVNNINILYVKNKLFHTLLYYLLEDESNVKNIVHQLFFLHLIKISDHYVEKKITLIETYILKKCIDMVDFLLSFIDTRILIPYVPFTIILSKNLFVNKIRWINFYFENGISVNVWNNQYYSLAIVAAYNNDLDMLIFLIDNAIDINYSGADYTHHLLTIAINNNNEYMIKLLLDNGINISVNDKFLRTPLHYVFITTNTLSIDIKRQLLQLVRDINVTDINLDSIFNLLVINNDWTQYIDILIKKKLDIYSKNKQGISPYISIKNGQKEQYDIFFDMVYQSVAYDMNKLLVTNTNSSLVTNTEKYISYLSLTRKKSGKTYNFIVPPVVNITNFMGYTYSYICYLYYILKKYPMIKIPSFGKNQMINKSIKKLYHELTANYKSEKKFKSIIKDYINHSPLLINHIIIWQNRHNFFISPYMIDGIYQTLEKYPDTKYILLKLSIISNVNNNNNHANILIYDIHKKCIERFDPYGNVPFIDNKMVDSVLSSFFNKKISNLTYLSPITITPRLSFQTISDENNPLTLNQNDPVGFCVGWCLWYVETRIKNYDIDPKKLIQKNIKLINKKYPSFKDYIRNYSDHLDKEKNKIIYEAGIPSEYWYKKHISYSHMHTYIKNIRLMYKLIT